MLVGPATMAASVPPLLIIPGHSGGGGGEVKPEKHDPVQSSSKQMQVSLVQMKVWYSQRIIETMASSP
jgi:hypothetical protein